MQLELEPTTFKGYQAALHPTHLAGPWGIAWGQSLGTVKDGVRASFAYAVKAHFITVCPTDGLPAIGYERGLERGPSESTPTYRLRLQGAWEAWTWGGTDKGIVDQLAILGYTAHVIRDRGYAWTDTGTVIGGVAAPGTPGTWTKVTLPGWSHDALSPIWGRMWIVLTDVPWTFLETYTAVAAAYATYALWAAAGTGYGFSALLTEIATITRIARKWTGSHALVVNIIVIGRGMIYGFPAIASYTALPADFLDSYIGYWDGF